MSTLQRNTFGFTLVELIVVITIIGILATVGFVSYSSYLTGARDSNRISQMSQLSQSLQVYGTKKSLPLPDNNVEITAAGTTIAYQGELGVDVLEAIDYSNGGKDPKDDMYYSYYVPKSRNVFQLMALMEEQASVALSDTSHNSLLPGEMRLQVARGGILSQSYAADYSERFPKVYGRKLGIMTDSENSPLERLGLTSLDVVSETDEYTAYLTDTDTIEGTGATLSQLIPNASCKRIKQTGGGSNSGKYTINPGGLGEFLAYCDMETAGGGWTLLTKNFGGPAFGTYGTPISNSDLWLGNGQTKLSIPFEKSGKFESAINTNIWTQFISQKGVELIKLVRAYDSGQLMEDDIYSYNIKIDLGEAVTFSDIINTSPCNTLENQVEMFIGNKSYGRTDRTSSYNSQSSIGFANMENNENCGQASSNAMEGWNARHVVSYNHKAGGKDTIRCQFDCWDGSENYVQEVVWGIK